jgi:hypothetical protein
MLPAATALRGSERIASMLTCNDSGWDMKMRLWETTTARCKEDVAFRLEQGETVGLGFALPPKVTEVVRIVRKKEAKPEVANAV